MQAVQPTICIRKRPGSDIDVNDFLRRVLGQTDSNSLRQVVEEMVGNSTDWIAIHDLETFVLADSNELVTFQLLLQALARSGAFEFGSQSKSPDIVLQPMTSDFVLDLSMIYESDSFRLSRFASVHRDDCGKLLLESPLGLAKILINDANVLGLLFEMAENVEFSRLFEVWNQLKKQQDMTHLAGLLALLRMAGAIDSTDSNHLLPEDNNLALRQWEFHDLLFHTRSRMGRHDYPMGGLYRFHHEINPRPAVKPNPWSNRAILLPRPSPDQIREKDHSLFSVMESRRSVRQQGGLPLSLDTIGEFLYRVARIRKFIHSDMGELTNRPYPNGGASYELELYLTIDRCIGLASGFYYYDPAEHALCKVTGANDDTTEIVLDACRSSGLTVRPQVVITIASRFQRVSWKYSGIAYATQLKNVGVLYGMMYLVATSMNLAPCALGLGNSERFCRLAGTSPFEEASIGEFMLSSSPTGMVGTLL